jgi:predicted  nucleic acid-binding Zn-ribbon protein
MAYLCRKCNAVFSDGSGAVVMPCPKCSGDAVRTR